MNKPLFLLILISSTIYPNKEELLLKQQQEKYQQEYRMEQLKTISLISLAVLATIVKIYYHHNADN